MSGPLETTLLLGACSTLLVLALGGPIAFWLARTKSRMRPLVAALTSLPLVLPPTVLGFYLLVLLGRSGPLGRLLEDLGLPALVFTFPGLVLGCSLHALPFVVQTLEASFRAVPPRLLEAAATMGSGPWDRFWHVIWPLTGHGVLAAGILGFAHALGEFGVVLMIGGSIPGETLTLSIALYRHVEAGRIEAAHELALGLSLCSFAALAIVQRLRGNAWEPR